MTPPAEVTAAPVAPATQAPVTAAPPRLALVLGILRAPASVRRGANLRLTLLSTESGLAELVITRKGSVIRRMTRTVTAGRFTLKLRPQMARGRYRVKVTLRTSDGRSANDAISVRVVSRR